MNKITLAAAAYPHAKAAHDAGTTITYGELAAAVGYTKALWHGEWADVMGIIAIEDEAVAACIVRKDTGKPGKGYYVFVQLLHGFHTGAVYKHPLVS